MANIFSPAFFVINGICLLILIFAFRRPAQAAKAVGLIFFLTAFINIVVLVAWPETYLDLEAVAVYEWYVRTIHESFQVHMQAVVISISLAQLLIGLGLFGSGNLRMAALFCALIFFWAISPFGAGAVFPAPVILSAACLVILFKINRKQHAVKSHG
ncbi:hypothetical protein [Chitinophaga rhizosphaerae]|uniref:hypothetical protein n=1 Tax=Chitinophaga rhizosphaerae TaxID=1864947 RepID=UPI000F815E6F|nr:hypothetical protein [Chitinophaga rhizosphaerae]